MHYETASVVPLNNSCKRIRGPLSEGPLLGSAPGGKGEDTVCLTHWGIIASIISNVYLLYKGFGTPVNLPIDPSIFQRSCTDC